MPAARIMGVATELYPPPGPNLLAAQLLLCHRSAALVLAIPQNSLPAPVRPPVHAQTAGLTAEHASGDKVYIFSAQFLQQIRGPVLRGTCMYEAPGQS